MACHKKQANQLLMLHYRAAIIDKLNSYLKRKSVDIKYLKMNVLSKKCDYLFLKK